MKKRKTNWKLDQEQGKFVLDQEYIFSLHHHDGFTEKLLSFDLEIKGDFQFELEISDFDYIPDYSKDRFQVYLEGNLPSNLKKLIEKTMKIKEFQQFTQFDPFHPGISDIGFQQILINQNNQTFTVVLPSYDSKLDEGHNSEIKTLFELQRLLNVWVEKICTQMKENCT